MFRDLKEYQQIQKIYEERVCISEEDRYITKELEETFTEDELNFIVENTEEVFAEIGNQLIEEGSEITEETIDEMAKVVAKALPLAQRMAAGFAKNVAKKTPVAGGVAKKAASGGGGLMKKAGGLIKKGVGFVKKNVGKIATAVGAGAAGGAIGAAATKSKPKVETDASGKVIPSTASIRAKSDRVGGGNAGASTDAGKASTANMPKATPVEPLTKRQKFDKKFIRIKGGKIARRGSPSAQRAEFKEKQMNKYKEKMAKRKAEGKTIQQVKDENKRSMKINALQRNVEFKAKRRKPPGEMKSNFAGGVSGKGKATDDFSKDPKYQSTAGTSTDIKKPVKQMGRSAAKRRQEGMKNELPTSKPTGNQKNNSKFENNPRVKEFRKNVKDLKTTAKYGSTATIQTQDGKEYKPGDAGYKEQLNKARNVVKKSMQKEEFTPYDIVLEYLLSSQQAATIEEANYIMTEMDAKTIQDIVS